MNVEHASRFREEVERAIRAVFDPGSGVVERCDFGGPCPWAEFGVLPLAISGWTSLRDDGFRWGAWSMRYVNVTCCWGRFGIGVDRLASYRRPWSGRDVLVDRSGLVLVVRTTAVVVGEPDPLHVVAFLPEWTGLVVTDDGNGTVLRSIVPVPVVARTHLSHPGPALWCADLLAHVFGFRAMDLCLHIDDTTIVVAELPESVRPSVPTNLPSYGRRRRRSVTTWWSDGTDGGSAPTLLSGTGTARWNP